MIIGILVLILLSGYYFLIQFYFRWWTQVPDFAPPEDPAVFTEHITVVIPARNEAANIEVCILSLLRQSYPRQLLEIIVVDDHSTDDTAAIVRRFDDRGVKLLQLQNLLTPADTVIAYKKKAIETAIGEATGTLIVTTDADCVFHPSWLSTIAAFYAQNKAVFIVAPVKINPGVRLLQNFQSLDFAILQGITGASVYKKMHNMCNGANLVYEKRVFNEVGGFKNIDHIPSGDDLLLMEKISTRYNDKVAYLKSRHAIVETLPATDWKMFLNQRIRWASKSLHYKDRRMVWVLLLVYALNLSLVLLLAGSLFFPCWLFIFTGGILLKSWIEWGFVKSILSWFEMDQPILRFILFQPLHIAYTVIAGFLGSFGSYTWKDRKVFTKK